MPFSLDIPFPAARLRITGGGELLMPLGDSRVISVNESFRELKDRFQKSFQKLIINEGKLEKLLEVAWQKDYTHVKLAVSFPASAEAYLHPAFELEFDLCYRKTEEGFLGILPALGLESYADQLPVLKQQLAETIKLEFKRNQRLSILQMLVSILWFEWEELQSAAVPLQVPLPGEKEKNRDLPDEQLLPRVAERIKPGPRLLFKRQKEENLFREALENPFSRSVLVVGAGGVGKTALVREIARQLEEEKSPYQIWETTASVLIKELVGQTGWQDNLPILIRELKQKEDILFVNNLLELFEVGQYLGNETSIGAFLQKYIEQGAVTLVAECTEEEKNRIELMRPNYFNSFHIIKLEEPAEIEKVVLQRIEVVAKEHKIKPEREAIRELLRLYRRFSPYSGFPGKPVRFLESALLNVSGKRSELSGSDIIRLYCEESGMPRFMVDPDEPLSEGRMKAFFFGQLFGQDKAIERLADVLISVKTAMTRSNKPIASLLFAGPTGVGKTELAKILAEFMFGRRDRMLRFDMSEFSSPYDVLRLIGTHYYSDGLLTSAIRREPFSVVLFDEIEKADPSFYDLLLQVLDEGRLSDSRGETVNFCSAIIIMTSNIGAGNLQAARIGWGKQGNTEEVEEHFLKAVRRFFRPELFNRIDQVIPFAPLSPETVRFVLEREIESFKKREGIQFRNLDLKIEEDVLDYLSREGYDAKYGARQLKRTIREKLIIPLARQLNLQDYYERILVEIKLESGEIAVIIQTDPLGLDLFFEELEKINLTDLAGELRRSLQRMESHANYLQVLSQLDLLEREKKKQREQFWARPESAERYGFYISAKERMAEFRSRIEKLEEKLSLACSGSQAYQPDWEQEVQAWTRDFLDFQVELFSHLNPPFNSCALTIFGKEPDAAIAFYLELFEKKGFEFKLKTFWKEDSRPPSDSGISVTPQGFWQVEVKEAGKYPHPPAPEAQLLGVEFRLSGPCVFAYLDSEQGKQVWKLNPKKKAATINILVFKLNDYEIPDKPEAPNFFSGQARRVLSPNHLQDNPLGINREVQQRNHLDMILEKLDANFVVRMKEAWF